MDFKSLLEQAKIGSNRAIDQIILLLEPIMKKELNRKNYYSNILSKDDFMQLYRLGIWMAIEKFPSRFYKLIKKDNEITFKEIDGSHRFVGWVKMCAQHHITKELRKEKQIRRKADIVSLDSNIDEENEISIFSKIPASISFEEASIGFNERLTDILTTKEATCFQLVANGYTSNKTIAEMKKQYPLLKRDDIMILKDKMLNKVKQGVIGYV